MLDLLISALVFLTFGHFLANSQRLPPVCLQRPLNCNILCPYGYLRHPVNSYCTCVCAIDPCQVKLCSVGETCLSIGAIARCIPKIDSTREACPRLSGGICALKCERDEDCQGRLICCSNGCGRECVLPLNSFPIKTEKTLQPFVRAQNPISKIISAISSLPSKVSNAIIPLANVESSTPTIESFHPRLTMKPGQCPLRQTGYNLIKKCANDFDCKEYQKCCATECGTICVDPTKATACIHFALAVNRLPEKMLHNGYIPNCDENGKFVPIQCDMQYCWCVDIHYGNEIAGSRISKAMRRADMCREFRQCFHKCTNDCAHGLVMDEYGCPAARCKCRDVCEKIKCVNPSDSCQLVEPDCQQPPCLPVPRCILNPCGSTPPMTLPTGVTALCTTNDQCGGGEFWCNQIGYNGLGFCCPGEAPYVKKERCPAKNPKKEALCGEATCTSDEHCGGGKCCFDGCTLSCLTTERINSFQTKITTPKKSIFHPGDVAKHNKAVLSSIVADCPDTIITAAETANCSSLCKGDFDCAGMRRCCRIGCSTSCMYPVRSTPCFHIAITAELYSLRNAKRCDVTGNFEQKQCDDNGCYCADVHTGDEQPGTRKDNGKVNCNVASPCTETHCQVNCPYGYELNLDGCPTCKCQNPCAEVKCPQGSMCIMSPVACYSHDNCPHMPRCLLNLCPIGEPYISSIGVVETCADDSECPKEHFCHKVGISSGGICCATPLPEIHQGVCPVTTPQLDRPFCKLECRQDGDCSGNRKCCYDGCGTLCRIPLPAPVSPELVKLIAGSNEDFEKPGDCPAVEAQDEASCEENSQDEKESGYECSSDADCAGVMRCCTNGCTRVCAFPDNLTPCLQFKAALQQLGQMDRIKCRPDGSYEEIQCDDIFCWCVDAEGKEIQGTRTSEDVSPNCSSPRSCPTLSCPINRECRFGVKKDEHGCDTCECNNPCLGVICPESSICIPSPAECIKPPCPEVPRCIVNPCAKGAPLLDLSSFEPLVCTDDELCKANNKDKHHCRLFRGEDGYCCPGPAPSVHPGTCPRTVSETGADCARECVTDGQCSQHKKCCYTGCGMACSQAEFSNELPISIHLGACMPVKDIGAFCVQRPTVADCTNDSDCPNLFKCCSDGCVLRCTPPHAATQCIHARIAALSLVEMNKAIFVPDCDSQGEFAEIQSHYGLMWCVDEDGKEVPGTKSTKVPNCNSPRICPVRSCAKICPFGFTTDNDGCEVCDCIEPCTLVLCPAGHVCRMIEPVCFAEQCEPIAKCIPNTCPSGKPLALESDQLVACTDGVACPAGYFCKQSGYQGIGFCCLGAPSLQTSFTCPTVPILTSSVDGSPCVVSCRYAADCPRSSCCFNGCGTSCQYETIQPSTKISKKLSKHPKLPRPGSSTIQVSSHAIVQPISPVNQQLVVQATSAPITPMSRELSSSGQKIGTCPMFTIVNPGCKEECRMDAQCPGYFKCCKASCGAICTAPRVTTACIHLLLAFERQLNIVGSNLPPPVQCNSDGTFRRHQCDIITKQCWCVKDTVSGEEMVGSRIDSTDMPPDCDKPRMCSVACNSVACSHGIRLDANGCPYNGACQCRNPCLSFVCPVSYECVLQPVKCTSHPCPDVPICVRDDLCGNTRKLLDDLRNTKACFSNSDCGEKNKCMSESADAELGVCCIGMTINMNTATPRTRIIAPVHTHILPVPASISTISTSTQRSVRIRPVSAYKKISPSSELSTGNKMIDPSTGLPVDRMEKKPFISVPLVKPILSITDMIRTREMLKTNCTTQRDAIENLFKAGISVKAVKPLCDESTGNFLSVQCDPFGTCWCVDRIAGIEIHGTRTRQAIGKDVCRAPRMCANHCLSAICPYGLLTDNFGCPRPECLCRSPCEEIECKTGDICILRRADCGDSWCLPIPVCEPTPCNIGLRPLVEPKTRQQFACMDKGAICPTGYYCTGYDKNMHGVCCPGKEYFFSSTFDHEQSCKHGDPFSSSTNGAPFTCTVTSNGCPPTHYCSTKAGERKGVCCVSKRYVCNLPMDRGPCSVSVLRYHYNSLNRTCTVFEYGGCSGNLNNFATENDCETFCSGVGLDLSSPYSDLSDDEPIESYQLGFSLSGPQITAAHKQQAESEITEYLSERFFIPHGSIEALSVRDDNTVRFTIRDVLSREFARNISDAVSSGRLAINLDGATYKAEPSTWFAHQILQETASDRSARMVFWMILLITFILALLLFLILCCACIFVRRKQNNKDVDSPSSNSSAVVHNEQRIPQRIERVFSREDVSIISRSARPSQRLPRIRTTIEEREVSSHYYQP